MRLPRIHALVVGAAMPTPAIVADAVVDDRRIERRRAKANAVERVHPDLVALERELAHRRRIVLDVVLVVAEAAVLADAVAAHRVRAARVTDADAVAAI